jgi:hypothetical protein
MQDMSDFMREFLDYYFTQVHTSFPGVVTEYDAKKRRATVQPSLKRRSGNKEYIAFPLLIDVPVLFPGTKKYTIHFPLEKDDEVAVFFSERALEAWKEVGQDEIEDPDPRRYSISDAYCIPGLQPQEFINATDGGLDTGLALIHKDKFDGKVIDSVLLNTEKIEVVRSADGKPVGAVTMKNDSIEAKFKEKADVKMENDRIKANTENCTLDMTGTKAFLNNGTSNAELDAGKITLDNGGDKIIADGGNIQVEADTKVTIKSSAVEITGGNFSMKGSVAPGTGPLCAIPNCLFTGAPHGGNKATGT